MRSVFMANVRHLKKSQRSGSGTDEIYVPTYEHYNEMLFLLGDEEPRPGISTINLDSQMDESSKTSNSTKKKINKSATTAVDVDLNEVIRKALKVLENDSPPQQDAPSDYISGFMKIIENNFRRINPDNIDDAFLEVTSVLSKFLKRNV